MNPRTLRTSIATRLRTISVWPDSFKWAIYERWPGPINAPALIVDILSGEPEQTMGRGDFTRWLVNVEAIVPLTPGWEPAQDRLDPILATSSTGGVFGALAGDRTLGGTVDACFVKSLPGSYERRVTDDGGEYLVGTVGLEIWAT